MIRVICHGKSNIGRHRANNEDAFILKPELAFVAVADGMGGSASGEVASQTFVETAIDIFKNGLGHSAKEISQLVQNTFQMANEKILEMARKNPMHQGMGCTADLMSFDSRGYVLGHVGDSRTYLHRDGRLRQITKDHSVVQEQIDMGMITPAEARNSSFRHKILRAVGVGETLAVDLIRGSHRQDDVFLLCSDGLTDMVDDPFILNILTLPIESEEKIDRLIETANANGGKDNITVILCEVKTS